MAHKALAFSFKVNPDVETVEKLENVLYCHSALDAESIKNQYVMDSCFRRNDTKKRFFDSLVREKFIFK